MYKMLGSTLTTIPGVNVITAVKILAEIGDIKRFSNANKLALVYLCQLAVIVL